MAALNGKANPYNLREWDNMLPVTKDKHRLCYPDDLFV